MTIAGKVAIVTGVNSGLGWGLVQVFTSMGVKVAGIGRRRERGEALEKEIAETGGQFFYVQGDVSRADDCSRLVDACLQRYGRIDILINNAALTGEPYANLEDTPEEQWDQVIGVNLKGPYLMCRRVLPVMKQQKDGVVINIASINAKLGMMRMAPYNVSKAGLLQLTKTVAVESFADNVRANVIILGGVGSEGAMAVSLDLARRGMGKPDAGFSQEGLKLWNASVMAPKQAAEAIALLCEPQGRLISGAEIAIDQTATAGATATLAATLSSSMLMQG